MQSYQLWSGRRGAGQARARPEAEPRRELDRVHRCVEARRPHASAVPRP